MAKRTRKKRPSMQDVADLAGVSRTTVSFVVNQVADSNIPPATQARVQAAVKELNYRPNALARGLRSSRTHTIGFISDEIATTPHAGQTIQGAQDLAWQHGDLILLINTGGDDAMKEAAVNTMLDRRVDGLIYATMFHRECNPPEAVRQLPTVLLDCYVADCSLPSVVPDEMTGGYEATKLLIEEGHTRIGFINNVESIPATHGRLLGYRRALEEHNLPFDESMVSVAIISEPASGHDATMNLMQRPDRPTALFCFNDRMAMGAYEALRKLGLAIPDDVAVVGFDDQKIIAANLYPPLTTMALPHYDMGKWAVSYLLELINNPDQAPKTAVQQTIRCPLVRRRSA